MGGMFTTLKVRENQKRGDYRDPGWYQAPKGTTAYEWTGEPPPVTNAPNMPNAPTQPATKADAPPLEVKKPHDHHH
jgi:hypothetical protein